MLGGYVGWIPGLSMGGGIGRVGGCGSVGALNRSRSRAAWLSLGKCSVEKYYAGNLRSIIGGLVGASSGLWKPAGF